MITELSHMMYLAEKYNMIAFDTEFPGIAIQNKLNDDFVKF